MTPKEKAKKLVEKYHKKYDSLFWDLTWIQAKQCALIAVDEVLNDDWFIPNREDLLARKEYWEEVKKEINNL